MDDNLIIQARELGEILIKNYESLRYDPEFTLWGFAFHWHGSYLSFLPNGDYSQFIPALLKEAKTLGYDIKEPECPVPKSRGLDKHYASICLSNQGVLEDIIQKILPDEMKNEVIDIISDRLLLKEAAANYISLNQSGALKNADFFTFLLRYNKENIIDLESKTMSGIYIPLAERLLYKYGEHDEDKIFYSNNEMIMAREFHIAAVYNALHLDPEVKKLYDRLNSNNENGNADLPKKILTMSLPGPRRVRVSTEASCLDWTRFFSYRKNQLRISNVINANEIYRNLIIERLINKYKDHFEQYPEKTLEELKISAEKSSSVEKEVLYEVLEIYSGAHRLLKDIGQ